MKNTNIFHYKDYKKYLKETLQYIKVTAKKSQKDFAETIRCQPAYVSRILNSDADLSLDQADATSEFFNLGELETDYFMQLVQLGRAGTVRFKKRIQKKLAAIKDQAQNIDKKFDSNERLPTDVSTKYYSDWYYSAIHLMLTIPTTRTPETIANYLGLSLVLVKEVLDFLVQSKMAIQERGEYKVSNNKFYLNKDSLLSQTSHRNWRILELNSMINPQKDDFHFSSIVTIDKKNANALKEKMLKCINECREVVSKSKEEDLFCYTIDLFSLKKNHDY